MSTPEFLVIRVFGSELDSDVASVLKGSETPRLRLPSSSLGNGYLRLRISSLLDPKGAQPPALEGSTWLERLGPIGAALRAELEPGTTASALLDFLATYPDLLGPHLEAFVGLIRREIEIVDRSTLKARRSVSLLVPTESLRSAIPEAFGLSISGTGEWSNGPLSKKNSPQPEYRGGPFGRLKTTRSLRAETDGVEDPLQLHFPGVSREWDHAYSRFFVPMLHAPAGCGPTRFFRGVTARYLGRDKLAAVIRPFFRLDDTQTVEATRDLFKPTVSERFPASCNEDEWIADRVLNGVHPCFFRRGLDNSSYVVDLNWNAYAMTLVADLSERTSDELGKDRYEQPNVRATFELTAQQEFKLKSIDVQYRKKDVLPPVDQAPGQLESWTTYTPTSGRLWQYAKHVFRCAWAFAGESDFHLARCHLLTEQYLAALTTAVEKGKTPQEGAYQALAPEAQHPFWRLLQPFLREVDRINAFGDALVIGPTGVMATMGALASTAVPERVKHQLGSVDWKGFRPRAPVCPTHRFAYAAKVYWEAICEHVEADVKANWGAYEADWAPIQRFSDALTSHSPLYRPYGDEPDLTQWHDSSEMASPRASDQAAMGAIRLKSNDDVVQLASHAIFHATFMHSWINDRQWDDCADPAFTSFGLMTRRAPAENETQEQWFAQAAPLVKHAAFQRAIMTILAHLEVGYVARGDPEPAYVALTQRLLTRADELAKIGALGRYADILEKAAAQPESGVETAITQLRARINT